MHMKENIRDIRTRKMALLEFWKGWLISLLEQKIFHIIISLMKSEKGQKQQCTLYSYFIFLCQKEKWPSYLLVYTITNFFTLEISFLLLLAKEVKILIFFSHEMENTKRWYHVDPKITFSKNLGLVHRIPLVPKTLDL